MIARAKTGSLLTRVTLTLVLALSLTSIAVSGLLIWLGSSYSLSKLDERIRNRAEQIANGPQGRGPDGPRDNGPREDGQRQGGGPGQPPQVPRNFGPGRDDPRRPKLFRADLSPFFDGSGDLAISGATMRAALRDGEAFGSAEFQGRKVRVVGVSGTTRDGEKIVVEVWEDLEQLLQAIRNLTLLAVAMLPLVILAAWWIGASLARRIIGPIVRLSENAARIARNPEMKERIEVPGSDELSQLATNFNEMTEQLQDSIERQRRFTGDAAHELRTPLTSIALAAGNGLARGSTADDKEHALKVVERNAEAMRKLTDVLLTMSRLDRGERLACSEIDLGMVAREAVEAVDSPDAARIEIVSAGSAVGWGSADAVLRIVRNLLENAQNYTPKDGRITLRVADGRIEVADTGEGIAAEHLGRIFERFYRPDPARSRMNGGFGLGLSICKALADEMGASLTVQSQVGVGTTFSLALANNPDSSQRTHG